MPPAGLCPRGLAWTDEATATDVAHASVECSNRGVCNYATGQCQCEAGYEGLACQRMSCKDDCSGAGTCISMRRNAETVAHLDAQYVYTTGARWDADKIFGCRCDPGADNFDCALRACPLGDDPMTLGQVDEIQYVTCEAAGGYFTLRMDGATTVRIEWDADFTAIKAAIDAIAGDVQVTAADVAEDSQACEVGGSMWAVTFLQRHGNVPALQVNKDALTTLTGAPVSIDVTDGASSLHPVTTDPYTAVDGTKEWLPCSGRGACNRASGQCDCYLGFVSSDGRGNVGERGDCGYDNEPITTCPGVAIECSGHGTCSDEPEFRCACFAGWTGGDCNERLCPSGRAWFDAPTADHVAHAAKTECSNRGTCDRTTGKCACQDGFTGAACERTTCPRNDADEECSGHGTCMSMNQLALQARTNGVPTPFDYGSPAPGVPATWDAFSMYGCKCDAGFHGFDCSLQTCPTGDDPKTPGVSEVQVLQCEADSGEFSLTFRGETTELLESATAVAADLKTALENLETIGTVKVTCPLGTASLVCDPSGLNPCSITFITEHGDVPDLVLTDETLVKAPAPAVLTVDVDGTGSSVRGTTEEATCANRGICNEQTGVCACFAQYGSSDGTNAMGNQRDCGYLLPFVPVTPAPKYQSSMWKLRNP